MEGGGVADSRCVAEVFPKLTSKSGTRTPGTGLHIFFAWVMIIRTFEKLNGPSRIRMLSEQLIVASNVETIGCTVQILGMQYSSPDVLSLFFKWHCLDPTDKAVARFLAEPKQHRLTLLSETRDLMEAFINQLESLQKPLHSVVTDWWNTSRMVVRLSRTVLRNSEWLLCEYGSGNNKASLLAPIPIRGTSMKLSFTEIAKRITGLSTPMFGISWTPAPSERQAAQRIITFLEDRRILFAPQELEYPDHAMKSVLQIREHLTKEMECLASSSLLRQSLSSLRAACRKFLDRTQSLSIDYHHQRILSGAGDDVHFMTAVGELRGVFGIQVAIVSAQYGIDVEDELSSILPTSDE